jgi:ankyrin repeat protein
MKRLDLIVSNTTLDGNADYMMNHQRENTQAGVFLYKVYANSDTALNLAICESHPAIVKLLLNYGARPHHQHTDGRTPLMEAAR